MLNPGAAEEEEEEEEEGGRSSTRIRAPAFGTNCRPAGHSVSGGGSARRTVADSGHVDHRDEPGVGDSTERLCNS